MQANWANQFISPSRLDNYLQFMTGKLYDLPNAPDYTIDAFIDSLLQIRKPSSMRKANAGTFGHSMLESLVYTDYVEGYWFDGINYCISEWIINIDCDIEVPVPIIRESPVTAVIAGCPIKGTVDAIDGYCVYDHKFTGQVDIEKYMESMQWKAYLLMTGRMKFVYNLFTVKVDDTENIMTIRDYTPLILWGYPGMREEVEQTIIEYRELLLSIKHLIDARIGDYNNQINQFIEQLNNSPIVTAEYEINQLITKLKTKFLKEIL